MRTTVSIDDEIYEAARRIAFDTRRTLGQVVNELLASGLRDHRAAQRTRKLGQLRDAITIADDFDDTPEDVIESFEREL